MLSALVFKAPNAGDKRKSMKHLVPLLLSMTRQMMGNMPELRRAMFEHITSLVDAQDLVEPLLAATNTPLIEPVDAKFIGAGEIQRVMALLSDDSRWGLIKLFVFLWLFCLLSVLIVSTMQCTVMQSPVEPRWDWIYFTGTQRIFYQKLFSLKWLSGNTVCLTDDVVIDTTIDSFYRALSLFSVIEGVAGLTKLWNRNIQRPESPPRPLRRSPRRGIKRPTCRTCEAAATMRCVECQTAVYCGEKCQAEDWIVHAKVCQKPEDD